MASANPPSEANTMFFLALYKKLSEENMAENIFFSPFSISSALAMVMLGAKANTATQMSEVLCFTKTKQPTEENQTQMMKQSPMQMQIKTREQMRIQLQHSSKLPLYLKKVLQRDAGEDEVHAHFQQLLTKFNKTSTGYTLSLANRLYAEQTYMFDKGFLEETKKYYQAELESVDFKNNAEAAKVNINNWVEEKTQDTMASSTPLSKANTNFSLELLKKLGDDDKTANIFFSPFSISSALAMVMLGSGGNTATQMSECLQTKGQDEVHASFAKLLAELNKPDAQYALSVANRLYGEQSYQFVETFLAETRKHYKAELESVDFIGNHEGARLNINQWVEKETQGKIKDVLVQGVLDSMTRLVLVNAIYFKGNWDKKFKETSTQDAKFRISKNATKPVKMMHQKSKFPLTFIPDINCQVLELPYVGKELSMLIFLPTDINDNSTGLSEIEKNLTYNNFMEWTRPDMMDVVEVQVGLPRFKMEEKYDMKNVLVSMGMVDAFDKGRSDFSGMSPANDLVLTKFVHKAFVEVNEEGTEAAAASVAIMMLRCAPITPRFIADHPFLFFIRHNASMSVLFAGRYCSPI
ncbi:serpin B6-like isoform X2 [Hippocampus zosterae]|uniref:serpin B6-like isoform X2 n=1 Tax=Hippocampus zosterae TaxID=109293 RepID=UPI00223CF427|nr:serpin B6-like isoform X2 [Hippocampus zosterae]